MSKAGFVVVVRDGGYWTPAHPGHVSEKDADYLRGVLRVSGIKSATVWTHDQWCEYQDDLDPEED